MNLPPPSVFAAHPVYALLRTEGAGKFDIEKIFDAYSGHPPQVSSVTEKFSDLRALGFADPVKMVTSSPAILGLAIDNIRTKLADLRALGFADPVKMVTSSPPILGYAIDNIRTKLRLAKRLKVDAHALIIRDPVVLGYSLKRIFFAAKVARSLDDGCVELFCFLLKKEPLATACAATDPGVFCVTDFRYQLRQREGRTAENAGLMTIRSRSAVARAYFKYVGRPAPALAVAA